ncbi:MAG: hypothetical protein JWQ35_287 [Bacteriovoracaceae bacterium]|nr:hypothetical protein [Bacteriovoracaceae bacterium]
MLLVKTKIGVSSIHGIGVFADQYVMRGTPMWKFQPGFDLQLTLAELDRLSEPARHQTLNYAYLDRSSNRYILCADDARFYNHSEMPNTGPDPTNPDDYIDVALLDIEPGEEILCNYRDFYTDIERVGKLVHTSV